MKLVSGSRFHLKPKQDVVTAITVTLVVNICLLAGFFVAKTPSGAYVPMFFPGLILIVGFIFDSLLNNLKLKLLVLALFVLLFSFNAYYSFDKSSSDSLFQTRLNIAKYIVKESEGKEYNLRGRGDASQFESFTMNYEYLAWWLGKGPSHKRQKLSFTIEERSDGIHVEKKVME